MPLDYKQLDSAKVDQVIFSTWILPECCRPCFDIAIEKMIGASQLVSLKIKVLNNNYDPIKIQLCIHLISLLTHIGLGRAGIGDAFFIMLMKSV